MWHMFAFMKSIWLLVLLQQLLPLMHLLLVLLEPELGPAVPSIIDFGAWWCRRSCVEYLGSWAWQYNNREHRVHVRSKAQHSL